MGEAWEGKGSAGRGILTFCTDLVHHTKKKLNLGEYTKLTKSIVAYDSKF